MTWSVLIVDDHDGFRSSARALLEADGFHVVGEAATGAQAVDRAARLAPDLVLLDIQLPDVDGFAVATALARGPRPPLVVLVSARDAAMYGPRLAHARFLAKHNLSGPALRALLGPGDP
ncbi:LytR/AlgR family response regulator transcription factor [Nonomuraea sp. NPDC059194]|uniref:LytR/AlgR family response regulator transcription factor n=1 Tax=Nonomuraea sp. NPDC059194 TaxID=3346764 RepID=UPI0036D14199